MQQARQKIRHTPIILNAPHHIKHRGVHIKRLTLHIKQKYFTHHIKHKTKMETLFIQTKKELKPFILNTEASPKLIDKVVNDLLDLYPNCDWWIEEGWK
jgi:hypothetical protein